MGIFLQVTLIAHFDMFKRTLLIFLIFLSLIILWPQHNFQEHLSLGDHGRDLYASQAVWRGEAVYKDYWWVYGPLMPYYLGLCAKLGGTHIVSLIAGKLFLVLLTSIFIFLGLAQFISPLFAFLAGLWFTLFHPDFFFTYNHQGGVLLETIIAYLLLSYFKRHHQKYAYLALASVFVLGLIKINFALTALVICMTSFLAHDYLFKVKFDSQKKMLYSLGAIGVPALLIVIYWQCFSGMTWMEIRQCQPYLGDDQPYNTSPLIALQSFIAITWQNIISNWMNITLGVILNLSTLYCLYLWIKKPAFRELYKTNLLIISLFIFWYAINMHEFLKSGVWYRSYWAEPFSLMLIFIIIDLATSHAHAFLRKFTVGFLLLTALIAGISNYQRNNAYKIPQQALNADGKAVYLTSNPNFIETITQTSNFLKKNLKDDELFFALPYDCLYYYLTGKQSPTRQLIFFEHIKIPQEQEQRIIGELEETRVNYVLISSRAFARMEHGLGIFGQTYCPLIADYINKNFAPIARFGDWQNEPGWAWNHGTLILKRK